MVPKLGLDPVIVQYAGELGWRFSIEPSTAFGLIDGIPVCFVQHRQRLFVGLPLDEEAKEAVRRAYGSRGVVSVDGAGLPISTWGKFLRSRLSKDFRDGITWIRTELAPLLREGVGLCVFCQQKGDRPAMVNGFPRVICGACAIEKKPDLGVSYVEFQKDLQEGKRYLRVMTGVSFLFILPAVIVSKYWAIRFPEANVLDSAIFWRVTLGLHGASSVGVWFLLRAYPRLQKQLANQFDGNSAKVRLGLALVLPLFLDPFFQGAQVAANSYFDHSSGKEVACEEIPVPQTWRGMRCEGYEGRAIPLPTHRRFFAEGIDPHSPPPKMKVLIRGGALGREWVAEVKKNDGL